MTASQQEMRDRGEGQKETDRDSAQEGGEWQKQGRRVNDIHWERER